MKRLSVLMILGISILAAACAPGSTPAQNTPAATQAVVAPTNTPVQTQAAAQPAAPDGSTPAAGDDIRTYSIVPEQTTAQYEVNEVFFNENNRLNTAIGVTNVVSGDVLLNFTDPQKSTLGEVTVDISTLTSDSGRRDNAIRSRWLESSRFPIVTFTTTSVEGLPANYDMGSEITFKVNGDMTVRDTTRPVTFDVTAKLDGDTLTGSAVTQIKMTDFNFDPPDIAGVLKADNDAKIVIKFVAVKK